MEVYNSEIINEDVPLPRLMTLEGKSTVVIISALVTLMTLAKTVLF
jgi:hypothetical protein